MESLGGSGPEALVLLRTAAVLGLTFRRDELLCISSGESSEVLELLRHCRDEGIIELDKRVGRFVHDLYREYFRETGNQDRPATHERVSACLQKLRPGAYERRCQSAIRAELPDYAATLAVQAALHRQRDGLPWGETDLAEGVMAAMERGGLKPVAERFESALTHLNQYRFNECLDALAGLPRDLSESLRAEADYLRATCLMATRSEEDRAEAREILEGWESLTAREAELGIRIMMLLLYALAMMVDKTSGRSLERKIRDTLSERSKVDPTALDALLVLDRCAGSLHMPERAIAMTQHAVDHFRPSAGQATTRRPIEYYRALVNYGANLQVTGDYRKAVSIYEELDELVESYTSDVFPRLDYARMNALLAQYRLGTVSLEQAANRQREIVSRHQVAGDPFYVENALAVYLALSEDHQDALDIFNRLLFELKQRREPEPSMEYLIRANRCATCFASGDEQNARRRWTGLTKLANRIPYVTRPYMVRRHALLAQEMARGEPMSARQFDECLVVERPPEIGPCWTEIGRGFWMPEIEWWR